MGLLCRIAFGLIIVMGTGLFGDGTGGRCRGLVFETSIRMGIPKAEYTAVDGIRDTADLGIGRVHLDDGLGLFFGSLDLDGQPEHSDRIGHSAHSRIRLKSFISDPCCRHRVWIT